MSSDYPVLAYFYRDDGTYETPIRLEDYATLKNFFQDVVRQAIREKRKIIITDPLDNCVFHAEDGKIFFDGRTQYPEGREV